MPRMIYISLPVSDLARAAAFYEAVGAVRNPQFCDGMAMGLVISETIQIMLMTAEKFREFSPRSIADPRTSSQVLLCLSAESREEVDDFVAKAVAAGGAPDPSPKDEYDFMYGRSFEDLDGHMWGVTWIDMAAIPSRPAMATA